MTGGPATVFFRYPDNYGWLLRGFLNLLQKQVLSSVSCASVAASVVGLQPTPMAPPTLAWQSLSQMDSTSWPLLHSLQEVVPALPLLSALPFLPAKILDARDVLPTVILQLLSFVADTLVRSFCRDKAQKLTQAFLIKAVASAGKFFWLGLIGMSPQKSRFLIIYTGVLVLVVYMAMILPNVLHWNARGLNNKKWQLQRLAEVFLR